MPVLRERSVNQAQGLSYGRACFTGRDVRHNIPNGSGDGQGFSSSGLVIGTPAYMSPEQAAGGDIGRSTDIYALGCLMYEVLAGEPPFTGAMAQAILARKLGEQARSLRVVRPEVPRYIEEAILAAPDRRPERRR